MRIALWHVSSLLSTIKRVFRGVALDFTGVLIHQWSHTSPHWNIILSVRLMLSPYYNTFLPPYVPVLSPCNKITRKSHFQHDAQYCNTKITSYNSFSYNSYCVTALCCCGLQQALLTVPSVLYKQRHGELNVDIMYFGHLFPNDLE